ncbi:hypothetical protein [Chryseobacterium sp. JK1]|uniref:hypothetical protein n=1 Tax=Chryseobacterium sp. JK1 TaxID=874294 RepID=UPI003D6905D7
MKTFVKYDFYIQLFFLILWPLGAILSGMEGWMMFYFIVGIPQLISFIIKICLKIKISPLFLIYGMTIMPVWISLLLLQIIGIDHKIMEIPGCIVIMAFFYSPFMGLLYVIESHNLYESLKINQ